MTKKERQQIKKAIGLLATDDGWDKGITILCDLAGIDSIYKHLGIKGTSVIQLRQAPTDFALPESSTQLSERLSAKRSGRSGLSAEERNEIRSAFAKRMKPCQRL
jgi:hypothetical protein